MRVVVVGEGILELARAGAGGWQLGYGGDMVNTAVHLARYGTAVSYATALGRRGVLRFYKAVLREPVPPKSRSGISTRCT
jgi:sugar/nucleoside kinase (ribokinase family)